jgi:uncharacterized protein (DUF983 family)
MHGNNRDEMPNRDYLLLAGVILFAMGMLLSATVAEAWWQHVVCGGEAFVGLCLILLAFGSDRKG